MKNEYRKVLAAVLSLSLLISPSSKNNSEVRNVAPFPVKIEEPKDNGPKLKKALK